MLQHVFISQKTYPPGSGNEKCESIFEHDITTQYNVPECILANLWDIHIAWANYSNLFLVVLPLMPEMSW